MHSISRELGIGRITVMSLGIQANVLEGFGDEDPAPYVFDIAELGERIPLAQLSSHVVKLRSFACGD